MSERERDREKVGQRKRGSQPQLSASVNVLTAHLNIPLCHELFVSPKMCVCVRVFKVLWLREWKCYSHGGSFYLGTISVPVHKVTSCCLPICLVTPLRPLALHVCISPDKRVSVETAIVAWFPTPLSHSCHTRANLDPIPFTALSWGYHTLMHKQATVNTRGKCRGKSCQSPWPTGKSLNLVNLCEARCYSIC